MNTHWAPIALLAALLAGCASDGVNPYSSYTRDDGVEVKAGNLIVMAVVEDAQAARVVQAALESTLSSSGATVQELGGKDRAFLLDYMRAKGEGALRASVRHYEAQIVARIRDPLAAMRVAWTLGDKTVWLEVDGKTAKLLDQGPNRYKLILDAKPGALVSPGDQILRKPDGETFSFKKDPFKLYLKEENQRIRIRLREETANLYPEERLAFLKIEGYQGDMNGLFGSLFGEASSGPDGSTVRLVHFDTVLICDATVRFDYSEGDGGDAEEGHDEDDEEHDGDDEDGEGHHGDEGDED